MIKAGGGRGAFTLQRLYRSRRGEGWGGGQDGKTQAANPRRRPRRRLCHRHGGAE